MGLRACGPSRVFLSEKRWLLQLRGGEDDSDGGSETITIRSGESDDGDEDDAQNGDRDELKEPDRKRTRNELDIEAEVGDEEKEQFDDIPDEIIPPSVRIRSIRVLNNPGRLVDPLKFEVTFDCEKGGLQEDLRWRVIWVGPAEDESKDQELEDLLVGPVQGGVSRFVLETQPLDVSMTPANELLGPTVVLVTCSYRDKKFIQVGYYVNVCGSYEEAMSPGNTTLLNQDDDELMESANPAQFWRSILTNEPRVSEFPILWDDPPDQAFAKSIPGGLLNETIFRDNTNDAGAHDDAVAAALEAHRQREARGDT